MIDQIEGTGKVIKAIGTLIAIFPGMAYLTGIVELPPSMVKTVSIIAVSVSTVVLIAVFLLGDWLRQLTARRAVIYSVSAVILGGIIVVVYSELAQDRVVHIPASEANPPTSFVTPVWPTDSFLETMGTREPTKDDYALAYTSSADPIVFRDTVHRESRLTRVIMYLLLLLAQVLLIAPVVAAAWKLAGAASAPALASDPVPRTRGSGRKAGRKDDVCGSGIPPSRR